MTSKELAKILDSLNEQKNKDIINQLISQTNPWLNSIKRRLEKEVPDINWNFSKKEQVYEIKNHISFLNAVVSEPFYFLNIKAKFGIRLLNTAIEWGVLTWGSEEEMYGLKSYLENNGINSITGLAKEFSGFGGYSLRSHLVKSTQMQELDLDKFEANVIQDITKEYQVLNDKIRFEKMEKNILLNTRLKLLNKKKQIILYGPPGTGKTYKTKQMAIELLDGIALEDSYFETTNLTESGKNVWIFQANPNKYDIFGALSDPNYIKNDWTVNQYRHRIKEGDIVLLWASGDKAGIYAMFEITSNPAMTIEEDYDRKFWKSEEDKGIPKLRVKMKLIKNLINNPISRDELKAINGLENLSIFKFFQGTNFPVDKNEWQIIKDKIEERR